ncbi:MAG TPA: DUF3426 domain-containing protein [Stellaceae bacterium]|nr:DUF3426 domain-containing protein [Stellaceae bacterium]
MIVTCPACSTRYLVDPRALGETGRVVRCANCAHTWHQDPAEDAPRRVELPPVEPPPAPEMTLRGAGRVQLPALAPPRRRLSGVGWAAYLIVLAGIVAGGLWFTRDQVVSRFPATARYYQMLGVPVETAEGSFDFHNVMPIRDTENGLPTLVIEGQVVNVSKVARRVPKLKVTLLDSNNHELQSWEFTVSDDRLLPGASTAFRTSIAQPNEAATMIKVSVAGSG